MVAPRHHAGDDSAPTPMCHHGDWLRRHREGAHEFDAGGADSLREDRPEAIYEKGVGGGMA